MEENKSHGWKYCFIILFVLNLVSYSPFLLILLPKALGFVPIDPADVVLVVFIPFTIFVVLPLAIVNVISILIFLVKQRPEGKSKIISYAFLAISVCLVIFSSIIIFKTISLIAIFNDFPIVAVLMVIPFVLYLWFIERKFHKK